MFWVKNYWQKTVLRELHEFSKDIKKLEDTGFELRKKYLENGYKGKILLMRNTRNY